jgi:hypothetical protein
MTSSSKLINMRPNSKLNVGSVGIIDIMHINVLKMMPLGEQKANFVDEKGHQEIAYRIQIELV